MSLRQVRSVTPNEDNTAKKKEIASQCDVVVHGFRNAPKALENLAVHLLQNLKVNSS